MLYPHHLIYPPYILMTWRYFYFPICQMRKESLREMKGLVQGHTTSESQIWNSSSDLAGCQEQGLHHPHPLLLKSLCLLSGDLAQRAKGQCSWSGESRWPSRIGTLSTQAPHARATGSHSGDTVVLYVHVCGICTAHFFVERGNSWDLAL